LANDRSSSETGTEKTPAGFFDHTHRMRPGPEAGMTATRMATVHLPARLACLISAMRSANETQQNKSISFRSPCVCPKPVLTKTKHRFDNNPKVQESSNKTVSRTCSQPEPVGSAPYHPHLLRENLADCPPHKQQHCHPPRHSRCSHHRCPAPRLWWRCLRRPRRPLRKTPLFF
jgi:hypothetical protein